MHPDEATQLEAWDRLHVWHPFTQMADYEPLVIESAEGCTLIDVHGRRYLDGVSSLWCNVHGHRCRRLDDALRKQLDQVAHTTLLGASHPSAVRLAKRLADIAPGRMPHVFFTDDGATAVESALKMAFQYWRQRPDPRPEKRTFAALGDAYHGDTLGNVSVGGVERFHRMFGPLLFDVVRLPSPVQYRLPPGVSKTDACRHWLAETEVLLAEHHAKLAAVVVEPLVQGAAGMIVHPEGYLQGLRELTRKYDVLLIADEVAVGMGRTGTMFACQQEGVEPDLLCLAKGLTGGYLPLAATLATTEIWNAFLGDFSASRQFFHGHTYGGNPLAAAVALANLDIFADDQVLAHLPAKIDRLAYHLSLLSTHPHVGDVRHRGLMAGIELVLDRLTSEPFPWSSRIGHHVCLSARRHGLLIRPLGNILVVLPPLSITLPELDSLFTSLTAALHEVLPLPPL